MTMMTETWGEMKARLLAVCRLKGWSIRYHNHPKTIRNWEKK